MKQPCYPALALFVPLLALAIGAPARGQSLDDLNIQLHGFATQAFVHSTNNDEVLTMNSSNFSPAWTEAAFTVTSQPIPKLTIGAQAHYTFIGTEKNEFTLDWAQVNYNFNDKLGIKAGKVKTPWGLYNDVQDLDPVYNWVLLPQSIYNLTNRDSTLTHYGVVAYGKLKFNKKVSVQYEGWYGVGNYVPTSGQFLDDVQAGWQIPSGATGTEAGGRVRINLPLKGFQVGASDLYTATWTMSEGNPYLSNGTVPLLGTATFAPDSTPNFFAKYENEKFTVAYEYQRNWANASISFPNDPVDSQTYTGELYGRTDPRSWYVLSNYRVKPKLVFGAYHSSSIDRQADLGPGRDSLDWAVNARYDINSYIYLKAEQHFVAGTLIYFESCTDVNNCTIPNPHTQITAFKLGVSF
jgi:hypothetical protein